jgi:hypothetical protein
MLEVSYHIRTYFEFTEWNSLILFLEVGMTEILVLINMLTFQLTQLFVYCNTVFV